MTIFGDGKTALRGGAGIFCERTQQNIFNFGGISILRGLYADHLRR